MIGEYVMPYVISSSEKTRHSASEHETKALLYLMSFMEYSAEIHYYIIDVFNDLTGMDRYGEKLWDVQSKAAKSNGPKAIGRELVTLFKNYISEFSFNDYILFVGGVSDSFRINPSINSFHIDNVKEKALKSMRDGLIEEALAREYIASDKVTEENINLFLENVLFVVDSMEASNYIKEILKGHENIIPSESILVSIFNEIRDEQSSKKNSANIEGFSLSSPDDAVNLHRHLKTGAIKLLCLQRIIHRNPMDDGVPSPFIPIYTSFPEDQADDMLMDCKLSLSKALFNNNLSDQYWALFEETYSLILSYPNADVNSIYKNISSVTKNNCPDLDILSLKYFIAVIKEGIQK